MKRNIFHYLSIERKTLTPHVVRNSLKGEITSVHEAGFLLDVGNGNIINVPLDRQKLCSLELKPGEETRVIIRAAEVVAGA